MVNNMTDLTAQEAAWQTRDHLDDPVIGELRNRFGKRRSKGWQVLEM